MSGPKIKRSNVNTAALPGLTGGVNNLLQSFLSNPQQTLGNLQQPNALQSQLGNTFAQLVNRPTAGQQAFNVALPQIQQQLQQGFGQDILGAAQPIFQRNLQLGADTLRQTGPRFASNTERLVGQQGQQAMQDFNLFSQNVLESGRARQLQALSTLGQLGGSADAGLSSLLGTAGQFSLGQSGQQNQLLSQLLGSSFNLGTGAPIITQQQPWWQQALNVGSQVAGIAGTFMGVPGGGKQGSVGGALPTNSFNPPAFGSSFGQGWGWRP